MSIAPLRLIKLVIQSCILTNRVNSVINTAVDTYTQHTDVPPINITIQNGNVSKSLKHKIHSYQVRLESNCCSHNYITLRISHVNSVHSQITPLLEPRRHARVIIHTKVTLCTATWSKNLVCYRMPYNYAHARFDDLDLDARSHKISVACSRQLSKQ